jgi:TAT (twin-arginine translocation) pathway signal sequence
MSEPIYLELEYSRRSFLAISAAAGATATLGPYLNAADALAKQGKKVAWPHKQLTARDAVKVNKHQFMPVRQFRRWNEKLDSIGPANQLGLRATGSRSHERYVDDLRDLLDRAGVKHLRFENVPMDRWMTDTWSFDLVDGSAAGPVRAASYIPYSGSTPPQGVTAPLVRVPAGTTPAAGSLTGKIAVFDAR